nr:thioredoxin family protein [Rhodococcus sp. (in: high G+C Gram-positive bacteria)]
MADLSSLDEMTEKIDSAPHVLVELWGTHCAPCRALRPLLEKMADSRTDWSFNALNVDTTPGVAERYSVRGTPTILLFKDGQEVNRTAGFVMPADLTEILDAI